MIRRGLEHQVVSEGLPESLPFLDEVAQVVDGAELWVNRVVAPVA